MPVFCCDCDENPPVCSCWCQWTITYICDGTPHWGPPTPTSLSSTCYTDEAAAAAGLVDSGGLWVATLDPCTFVLTKKSDECNCAIGDCIGSLHCPDPLTTPSTPSDCCSECHCWYTFEAKWNCSGSPEWVVTIVLNSCLTNAAAAGAGLVNGGWEVYKGDPCVYRRTMRVYNCNCDGMSECSAGIKPNPGVPTVGTPPTCCDDPCVETPDCSCVDLLVTYTLTVDTFADGVEDCFGGFTSVSTDHSIDINNANAMGADSMDCLVCSRDNPACFWVDASPVGAPGEHHLGLGLCCPGGWTLAFIDDFNLCCANSNKGGGSPTGTYPNAVVCCLLDFKRYTYSNIRVTCADVGI